MNKTHGVKETVGVKEDLGVKENHWVAASPIDNIVTTGPRTS